MKKLVVNENCIGCGACVAIDSAHFDFNESGLSTPISNENLDTDELKNAISSCPVNAIKIVETDSEKSENDNADEGGCQCENEGECHCENDECHCQDGCCKHE